MLNFEEVRNSEVYQLLAAADREKAFLPSADDPGFSVQNFLESQAERPNYHLFVTTNKEGLQIGFISLFPYKEDGIMSIGPMFVDKTYRSLGVGRWQARQAIEWAKESGILGLHSKTWGKNLNSRKIHEDLGFTMVKEVPNDRIDGDSTISYKLLFRLK